MSHHGPLPGSFPDPLWNTDGAGPDDLNLVADRPDRRIWSVSGANSDRRLVVGTLILTYGGVAAVAFANFGDLLVAASFAFLLGTFLMLVLGGAMQSRTVNRATDRLERSGVPADAIVTTAGWEAISSSFAGLWIAHYRYSVAGSEHEGEREFLQGYRMDKTGPPISPGDSIVVLYDPDAPGVSGWMSPSFSEFSPPSSVFARRV
jgi:hypothetical protein